MAKNLPVQADKVLEEARDLLLLVREALAQFGGIVIDVRGNLHLAIREGQSVHGVEMNEGKTHAEAPQNLSDDSVAPAGPDVVYRRIERVTLAGKCGAAAAGEVMMIEDQHALAHARQKPGRYHASDARPDYDHVVAVAQVGFVDRDHIQIVRLPTSRLPRCVRNRRGRSREHD